MRLVTKKIEAEFKYGKAIFHLICTATVSHSSIALFSRLQTSIPESIVSKMVVALETFSHRGLTDSRFLARAKATNGLGTTSGLVWKVLRGFENISRGALGENGR